jgi:hypothetical protein
MRDFKFFQKEVKGTLDTIDGETYPTASYPLGVLFNADGPDSHIYRRHLYHTNRDLYDRLRNPNNVTEQYLNDRNLLHDNLTADRRAEITRRINGGGTDNQIRLFQTTTVTTVNPKWWMKIKMFYQKYKYNSVIETNSDLLWIFLISTSITLGVGFIIAKILNVW